MLLPDQNPSFDNDNSRIFYSFLSLFFLLSYFVVFVTTWYDDALSPMSIFYVQFKLALYLYWRYFRYLSTLCFLRKLNWFILRFIYNFKWIYYFKYFDWFISHIVVTWCLESMRWRRFGIFHMFPNLTHLILSILLKPTFFLLYPFDHALLFSALLVHTCTESCYTQFTTFRND